MIQQDTLSAMARFQEVCEWKNILGNEGKLDAMAVRVVDALDKDDSATVVAVCGQMIEVAEAMPQGKYLWPEPRKPKSNSS